jgi:predicted RNA-binding protein YlxR (DUF448 family)
MKPKEELIKIVKNKDLSVQIDPTYKMSGRGAYVCKNQECKQKLFKKRLINRTFSMQVEDDLYNKIINIK